MSIGAAAAPPLPKATIAVHPSMVSVIIGKGGASVKELRKLYGVQFDFPKPSAGPSPTGAKVQISITGQERDMVERAKAHVQRIVADRESFLSPGVIESKVVVPLAALGFIIGKGGKGLQALKAGGLHRIIVPDRDGMINVGKRGEEQKKVAANYITLIGPEGAVNASYKLLKQRILEWEEEQDGEDHRHPYE